MHVAPHDIRFAVVVAKTTITPQGTKTEPHVLHDDLLTRNDAHDKQPTDARSTVIGYVSDRRRTRQPTPTTTAS